MTLKLTTETLYNDTIYTSRDLNRSTAKVLDKALEEPVTITRNNDSFALLRREKMGDMSKKILYTRVVAYLYEAICKVNMQQVLDPGDPYKWVDKFDREEHIDLLSELSSAMQHSENTDDWEELRCLILEWSESAIAISSDDLDDFKAALGNS